MDMVLRWCTSNNLNNLLHSKTAGKTMRTEMWNHTTARVLASTCNKINFKPNVFSTQCQVCCITITLWVVMMTANESWLFYPFRHTRTQMPWPLFAHYSWWYFVVGISEYIRARNFGSVCNDAQMFKLKQTIFTKLLQMEGSFSVCFRSICNLVHTYARFQFLLSFLAAVVFNGMQARYLNSPKGTVQV